MAEPASTQAHLLFCVIAQHYVARPALALPRKQGHLLFPCYSTALRCRASKFGCIPASPPRYSLHPLIQRSFLHIISRCSRYLDVHDIVSIDACIHLAMAFSLSGTYKFVLGSTLLPSLTSVRPASVVFTSPRSAICSSGTVAPTSHSS